MINKLIEGIQSGDLNNNQILTMLVKFNDSVVDEYNTVVDEYDTALAQIAELEAADTLAKLSLAALTSQVKELTQDNATLTGYTASLSSTLKKVNAHNATLKSDLIRLQANSRSITQLENENKGLKANKAKHLKKKKAQEIAIATLTNEARVYRQQIAKKDSDIARLRLTGNKVIGKYSFCIFPSLITTHDGGHSAKKVALAVFNEEGCFKIIRTAYDDGAIIQPRSHNFKFNAEQTSFIEDFCKIAKADGQQFTNRVLQLVN